MMLEKVRLNYKGILFFALCVLQCFFAVNCKRNKSYSNASSLSKDIHCDSLQEAEQSILDIQEVREKQKLVDSISNHQRGISFLSDSLYIQDAMYYDIQVGYNNEMRFEVYYNFRVKKGNCTDVKILEPISADYISIDEWRKFKDNL